MKQHHFDIEHAAVYGVFDAVVINHFQFWIFNNRANGVNFHDGHTWSYNSVAALTETFSYWKPDQIRRTLERLVNAGVLIKGMYAKKLDRSTWYAFADEEAFLGDRVSSANMPNRASTRQKSRMSSANKPDEFGISAESSIYTDKNTVENTDKSAPSAPVELASTSIAVIVQENRKPVEQVFAHWQAVMQIPRAKLDAKRRAAIEARFKDGYTVEDLSLAVDGCRKSDWHMGKNDKNKAFNDIELICRDASRVDGFITQALQKPAQAAGSDADWQGYLQRRQQRQAGNDPFTIDMEA